MFLARRPSRATIDRFVRDSHDLPLSYSPIGIANGESPGRDLDEATVAVGHGATDFERARAALVAWQQFNIGWVETFPSPAPIAAGTVVAVLIRHLGFWSLNGCRGDVMYRIRAISSPRAMAARVGQPLVRALQARFRRDSAAAIQRATRADGVRR